MEYNIDNVNITDCVVYFVLQELTSQLVTPSMAGLHYMRRVSPVARVPPVCVSRTCGGESSWTEVSYIQYVSLSQ